MKLTHIRKALLRLGRCEPSTQAIRRNSWIQGLDTAIQALAAYKWHDPENMDERENMENRFDALFAALILPSNG